MMRSARARRRGGGAAGPTGGGGASYILIHYAHGRPACRAHSIRAAYGACAWRRSGCGRKLPATTNSQLLPGSPTTRWPRPPRTEGLRLGGMNLRTASVGEVGALLDGMGLARHIPAFKAMAIDGLTLVECTDADLAEVGVDSPQDRKSILSKVDGSGSSALTLEAARALVETRTRDLQAAILLFNNAIGAGAGLPLPAILATPSGTAAPLQLAHCMYAPLPPVSDLGGGSAGKQPVADPLPCSDLTKQHTVDPLPPNELAAALEEAHALENRIAALEAKWFRPAAETSSAQLSNGASKAFASIEHDCDELEARIAKVEAKKAKQRRAGGDGLRWKLHFGRSMQGRYMLRARCAPSAGQRTKDPTQEMAPNGKPRNKYTGSAPNRKGGGGPPSESDRWSGACGGHEKNTTGKSTAKSAGSHAQKKPSSTARQSTGADTDGERQKHEPGVPTSEYFHCEVASRSAKPAPPGSGRPISAHLDCSSAGTTNMDALSASGSASVANSKITISVRLNILPKVRSAVPLPAGSDYISWDTQPAKAHVRAEAPAQAKNSTGKQSELAAHADLKNHATAGSAVLAKAPLTPEQNSKASGGAAEKKIEGETVSPIKTVAQLQAESTSAADAEAVGVAQADPQAAGKAEAETARAAHVAAQASAENESNNLASAKDAAKDSTPARQARGSEIMSMLGAGKKNGGSASDSVQPKTLMPTSKVYEGFEAAAKQAVQSIANALVQWVLSKGSTVPKDHMLKHLAKLGLRKICVALQQKFVVAPTTIIVDVLVGLFDKHGTGILMIGDMNQALKLLNSQVELGGNLDKIAAHAKKLSFKAANREKPRLKKGQVRIATFLFAAISCEDKSN